MPRPSLDRRRARRILATAAASTAALAFASAGAADVASAASKCPKNFACFWDGKQLTGGKTLIACAQLSRYGVLFGPGISESPYKVRWRPSSLINNCPRTIRLTGGGSRSVFRGQWIVDLGKIGWDNRARFAN